MRGLRGFNPGGCDEKDSSRRKKPEDQPYTHRNGGLLRIIVPKKTRFAAVDIGSRETKVVEVSTADSIPVVTAYGRFASPAIVLGDTVGEEAMVNALKEVFLTSGIQSKEVIATISGERVITRHIKVPVMPAKELENAVMFEAETYIPIPVEELTIRYVNLGEIESGSKKYLHLLLAAVPTTMVFDYYGIFTRAGLIVAAIDLQSLGLWRVFSGLNTSAAREGTVGILDIGASATQLVVVRDRALQLTRILPVGGNLLTHSLAENYGLNFEQAQRLKEDEGELLNTEAVVSAAAGAMQMDFSLRDGLSSLVREIRRSLDYYTSQEGAAPIERFIISGGTSKLIGFREFFAEAMEAPVDFGNPGVPGLPGDDSEGIPFDPAFAVVLGTALREVVE
ncbi:MAG: type IV pilus assembly protein PilM [Desulfotomaculaceae bacterium]|nr:type IV pilus assembly protein PilM [Desulfotomaculaceae bacterium]